MTRASKGAMISGNAWRWLLAAMWVCLVATVRVDAAAETVFNTRDTLVYKDGDRVQGTLVQKTADGIVFKSDRFGELRVKAGDAVVIPAEKKTEVAAVKPVAPGTPGAPPMTTAKAAAAAQAAVEAAVEQAEEERVTLWDRFSPGVLTAQVREFFGPWHGRVSFSADVISDVSERDTVSLEGRLTRKWKSDEVQLTMRYDYAETNELPTTDTVKFTGSWRHEFNKTWFGQYRPTAEWNRASKRGGLPNDYLLLQQEIGVGYHLYTTASRKVRLGVSQNLFDIWNTAPVREHDSRGVPSAFEEVELRLPWQMGLSQRGVWYPVKDQKDGWENRVELNKKLTETLSTAIRHEIRRNNPDGSSQDYTRLKLLFGLDF